MEQTNRLKNSLSPYLLQHADNPVAWLPWGEEAFSLAKSLDKPIFLSIGYSACHWCHVMAHECFEDRDVAKLMNDAFVNVKVDREELPHIDHLYMRICQMMTGSGGWPLTIIMTPDREPFYAATFLPKHSRSGLAGMMELVPLIRKAWETNRGEISQITRTVAQAVKARVSRGNGEEPGAGIFDRTFTALAQMFRKDTGGFSTAPKFPSAHHLMFLLRHYYGTGSSQALEMVETTLTAMRLGGIYDHLGHGFHRYATDSQWRIPHFEKMLYDQALLAIVYTEAFLVTSREIYRKTARETLDYVLGDMRSPEGVFFSARDADTEGEEGGYYLWKDAELRNLLGEEDYRLFTSVFAVEPGGNFAEGRAAGKNILFMKEPLPAAAGRIGIPLEKLGDEIGRISEILLEARSGRVPPQMDDKSLADWNGLMIAALARAGAAFAEQRYVDAACAAADFILNRMKDGQGRLLHVYRNGVGDRRAWLDDYAYLIWGLIEIYEATFRASYLAEARRLMRECLDLFGDPEEGGFFLTARDSDVVIARIKEFTDNALPSGNSVALYDLVRLARITGDPSFDDAARGTVRACSGLISSVPAAATFLASGLLLLLGPSREIAVAGSPERDDTKAMLRTLLSSFLPDSVIVLLGGEGEGPLAPRGRIPVAGKATAYVCQGSTCMPPVTGTEDLVQVLSRKA